jgi:hypothetical protein
MNHIDNVTPAEKASPITGFVITLGKLLLKNKCKDWLDMDGVAEFCRDKAIQLNRHCPASRELESELRQFFKSKDEFYAPGINVDGYERPSGWDRPFMIRAFPYSQSPDCGNSALAELDATAPMTACSD